MKLKATLRSSYKPFLLLVLLLCVSDTTVTANDEQPAVGGGTCINGQVEPVDSTSKVCKC